MESGSLRRWSLAVALAATVAAAGWVAGNQQASKVVPAAAEGDARASPASGPDTRSDAASPGADDAAIELDKLLQRPVARKFGEMFPARDLQPRLPAGAAPRKPEPPRAPPLPFRFFGRMIDNGTTLVFLDRQDDVYAVKAGDTIAGTYRVEEISGTEVVLTYLPLKQRQTLQIGTIN